MLTWSKPWPPEAAAAVFFSTVPTAVLTAQRVKRPPLRGLDCPSGHVGERRCEFQMTWKLQTLRDNYQLIRHHVFEICWNGSMIQTQKKKTYSELADMWYAHILCPPESPGVSEASPQHPMHHLWHIQSVSTKNISSFQTNRMYYLYLENSREWYS